MKQELNEIKDKLDVLDSKLDNVDRILAVNTEQLSYHIRRTNLLESQLVPIKAHVEQIRGAGKLLFIASLIATILAVFLA